MPVDYQSSKIYKLQPEKYNEGDEILTYFGSTCENYLSRRLASHVRAYKNYLKGKGEFYTAFNIFEKHSVTNIVLSSI